MTAHNPIPVIVFILASRLVVGLATAAAVEYIHLQPCTNFLLVLTGCDGTLSTILSVAFGAVPGAPGTVNGLIEIVSNLSLVWATLTWARGS